MKPVVIFGGGDQARTAFVYLTQDAGRTVVAFTAHQRFITESRLLERDLVPFEGLVALYPPERYDVFVALGYGGVNQTRAAVYAELKTLGYRPINYVSSHARLWQPLEMGDNCFVMENAVIQPFAHIGNNVVIGLGALIGHDVRLGDHCFIGPGAVIAGAARVGPFTFVGANATIRNNIAVGARCIIGAAANVLRPTRDGEVLMAAGTPTSPRSSEAMTAFLGLSRKTSHDHEPHD